MWFTPAATASRSRATAASGSRGGPHTPGPASCIAPYPMRRKVMEEPGSVKVPPSLVALDNSNSLELFIGATDRRRPARRLEHSLCEEVADHCPYLFRMSLEREVTCIEEMDG